MQEPETQNNEVVSDESIQMEGAIYWMATVTLYYKREGMEKQRQVNVLLTTQNAYLTQRALGEIQKSAQMQVYERKLIPEKATISDVIISNIAMLGVMTKEMFIGQSAPAAD